MATQTLYGLDNSILLDNMALPMCEAPSYGSYQFWNQVPMNSWDQGFSQQEFGGQLFCLDESALDEILTSGDLQSIMQEEGSPSNWIVPPIGCNEKLVFNQICTDILLSPAPKQSAFEEVPHLIIEEAFAQRKPFYYIYYNPQDENAWRWDNLQWSQSGTWRKITEGQLERVSFSLKSDRSIKRMATRKAGQPNGVVVVIYFFK